MELFYGRLKHAFKSKKAKSRGRLRPLLSELSKIWFRPQITTLLSRNSSEPQAQTRMSPAFPLPLSQELSRSPSGLSCLKLPSCLEPVSSPRLPAGFGSTLFLEDLSSVGFDTNSNSLTRKYLTQISSVEIEYALWETRELFCNRSCYIASRPSAE
jgi:hypothetical protein